MMKKAILPLMMMLATIAVVPGNNSIVRASAEETTSDVTNKQKTVSKGYITKNLVSNGAVTLNDSNKTKFENNFTEVKAKKVSYDDSIFCDRVQQYWGTQSAHRSDGYIFSKDDYDNTRWEYTSYLLQNSSQGAAQATLERFVNIRYGLDLCFEDWDKNDEQPFELAIPINLDEIKKGISICYPFIQFPNAETITRPTEDFEDTFPIISINGYDYFTATVHWSAADNQMTVSYNSNNSRAYLSYNTNKEYAGYVFLEIPFTSYLQTLNIATYIKAVGGTLNANPILSRSVYLCNNAKNSSFKAPIVITDLDFKKGTVTTITSNSVYLNANDEETINAVDTEYIRLNSLIINDKYTLYTKRTGEHPTPREDLYELYIDNEYKTRFTYDANNELAKTLREDESGQKVTITKYNYSILKKENLSSTEYATTSDFVDCGTYYGFKKINKDQIHTVTFNSIASNNGIYSRIAFNAYDSVLNTNLSKINALMFQYSFNGTLYNLSISGEDISQGVPGGSVWFPGVWQFIFKTSGHGDLTTDLNRTLSKTDENGIKFSFHGMKDTDYISFDWTGNEELKASKQSNMFILYCRNGAVKFNSLVSCVYVDKVGDLINCSTIFPNGVEAPTAIIGDDGKVTIVDVNGNIIPGTVNEKGFFVDDKGTPWEYPSNVPDPTNPWDKILKPFKQIASIVCTVAIVAGVIWTISKVGPTLVMIFKKKE